MGPQFLKPSWGWLALFMVSMAELGSTLVHGAAWLAGVAFLSGLVASTIVIGSALAKNLHYAPGIAVGLMEEIELELQQRKRARIRKATDPD